MQPFVLNGTLNQNNGNYFYMLNVLENQKMLSVRISFDIELQYFETRFCVPSSYILYLILNTKFDTYFE